MILYIVLWILWDVGYSARANAVAMWSLEWWIWLSLGLGLGALAFIAELLDRHKGEQETLRHEQAMAALRDKLDTHDKFMTVIAGISARTSVGVDAIESAMATARQEADTRRLLDRLMVLSVVSPPPPTEPTTITYKLKAYVTVRNDTGTVIQVGIPIDWLGTPLFIPQGARRIASSLQLVEAGRPQAEAQELSVQAGHVFRFWLGFDPALRRADIDRLHAEARLGRFTMPVMINGARSEWSKTI